MSTRVVVLSDTHVRRGGGRRLPDPVYAHLETADVILHAGDIVVSDLLDELGGFAPVYAVLGNNDLDPGLSHLPLQRLVEVEGVRVGMVHDSGQREGRAARMRRLFPDAGVVVFGHSHIPWNGEGLDGQVLFNPGSPTDKRMQPVHTFGVLEVDGPELVSARLVELEAR
ncbi:MAG TPA: metallophosphoesterase family protein [Acidimicrobiales bacterium]|nr:metallophosphoesterase family protein [Acidimicrobiales bacterium]